MSFKRISDIKAANRDAGFHFFEKASMRFFHSKVYPQVYGGRYFVTSEYQDDPRTRMFTVREATDRGDIRTVGGFRQYGSLGDARDAAKSFGASPPVEAVFKKGEEVVSIGGVRGKVLKAEKDNEGLRVYQIRDASGQKHIFYGDYLRRRGEKFMKSHRASPGLEDDAIAFGDSK